MLLLNFGVLSKLSKSHSKNVYYLSLISKIKHKSINDYLDNSSKNIIWLPITFIKDSISDVIDIEVPLNNTFTANGIIVHNCQIEKTLYKYDGRPGSPKVFNLWSQVAKTRILAYLKKEKRDKKNMPAYKDYVVRKYKTKSKSIDEFSSFLEEISNFFEYDENYKELCLILKRIWETDPKPYDGLKNKLVQISKKDPIIINQFLKLLKLHRDEFTINNKKDHEFEELESNEGYFYMDHDDF
jgi:hypothetical protein